MTTLAELDTGISSLVAALARGELKVRFSDGREVTYNSADDISARLRALRLERTALIAGGTAPTMRLRSWPVVMRRD